MFWKVYTQNLTTAGRWLAIPTGSMPSFGALSMFHHGHVVFCYLFAPWVLATIGMILLRPRVWLRAWYAPRACAGETLPVDVEVEQRGRLAQIELHVLPHATIRP